MFERSILVVDDEQAIAVNLTALLEARGYKVSVAGDGKTAVETARLQKPDLILLDVKLPVLGGFEVCRILKEDPATKKIKILMLTVLDTLGDVEKSFAVGADDYLNKPFTSDRLLEKIKKLV